MNAGSSTIRTSVASTSTASVSPRPNIRMKDTCAAISAANEIDITSAAAVTTRPVRATPSATLSSLSALRLAGREPELPDPGNQEHLVVHRQAEGDAEQQHRHVGDQGAGRCRPEGAQMPVLEYPHHRAERGGERKRVEHKAFRGSTTLPVSRNSSTKVMIAMRPSTRAAARRWRRHCRG